MIIIMIDKFIYNKFKSMIFRFFLKNYKKNQLKKKKPL